MNVDYSDGSRTGVNTQYYQIISEVTKWISAGGGFGGSYVDTSNYPASKCTDSVTLGNCITDGQIRAEFTKVMTAQG
jgi:hypothetical protein